MRIKSISLKNFRNCKEQILEFDKGLNLLYGDNAQGKTNILEAIYLSSTTKSHKGSKDKEMIRMGEKEAHIRMLVEKDGMERKIDLHLNKTKTKGMAIDGITIKRAVDLFGLVNIVFFSPEDLSMVKNGPSERRRFIDMELSQLDRVYLYHLSKYNKVLEQRNNLLRQLFLEESSTDLLDIWDEQLLRYGLELIRCRRAFIEELNVLIQPIHEKLTGGKEEIHLVYMPNTEEGDFADKISKARKSDICQKVTSVGPQRDDIVFFINGIDVRKYGSQGQQRSTALSLKLSEIELFKKVTGHDPILLLDDVLSELDRNRQNYLISGIGESQTVITCTGLEEFVEHHKNAGKIYKVTAGKAEEYK